MKQHLLKSYAMPAFILLVWLAILCAGAFSQVGGVVQSPTKPQVGFMITPPEGATGMTVKVYDWDPLSDDFLGESPTVPVPTPNANGEIYVGAELVCIDGIVYGSHGSSGESTAEVYIIVEWDPDNLGETETSSQSVSCN